MQYNCGGFMEKSSARPSAARNACCASLRLSALLLAFVFAGFLVLGGLLNFGKLITHIASAVFVGVLLKAGLDVLDRDFPLAWLKYKWAGNKARNIQFAFILYTTLMTVLVDLNVAVVSGTVLFILGRKFMGFTDAEEDFAVVHENESMKADL